MTLADLKKKKKKPHKGVFVTDADKKRGSCLRLTNKETPNGSIKDSSFSGITRDIEPASVCSESLDTVLQQQHTQKYTKKILDYTTSCWLINKASKKKKKHTLYSLA